MASDEEIEALADSAGSESKMAAGRAFLAPGYVPGSERYAEEAPSSDYAGVDPKHFLDALLCHLYQQAPHWSSSESGKDLFLREPDLRIGGPYSIHGGFDDHDNHSVEVPLSNACCSGFRAEEHRAQICY